MKATGIRRTFRRDERGVSAVETAIGLPALLTLIVGILELSNYYFLSATMENAVLHASRFGITGESGSGGTREEQVREVIEKYSFGRIDMDTVDIETLVYEQFADIGEPEPFTDQNANDAYDEGEPFSDVNGNSVWDADMATAGLGNSGDIVLYRIRYEAPSLTGAFDWATRAVALTATVAVRNEPY